MAQIILPENLAVTEYVPRVLRLSVYDSTTVFSLLRIPYFSLHFHATVLQVVGSATTTIFDHIEICGAARERTRDKPLAYFQLAYILRQVEWCSVLSIRPS